jgi:ActR/RegA family two-component response regulator
MTEARTLLVVDDDDAVATAISRVFERRGWAVHRARNGSEAMALARGKVAFAAAVVDLVLPGRGGLDVVRELREQQPECRIVGVTGLSEAAMTAAFQRAGADAFVGKPFEIGELVGAVEPDASA